MWSLKGNTSGSIIMTQMIFKVLLWKFSVTSFVMHWRKQILLLFSPNPVSFNNARKNLEQIFSLSVTGCYWLCSCPCLQIPKATADNWQNEQNTSTSLLLLLSVTRLNKLIRLLTWLWVIPWSAKMGTISFWHVSATTVDLRAISSFFQLLYLPLSTPLDFKNPNNYFIFNRAYAMYACVGV